MKSYVSPSKHKNLRKKSLEIAHKSSNFHTADKEGSSAALPMTPAPFTMNSLSADKNY
jgi:hypothetical protein